MEAVYRGAEWTDSISEKNSFLTYVMEPLSVHCEVSKNSVFAHWLHAVRAALSRIM
jgi:hypothetical protein